MITIQLSAEDARFLTDQLSKQARHVEGELDDTKPGEKDALSRDLEHLRTLLDHVSRAAQHESVEPEEAAAEQRPPSDS